MVFHGIDRQGNYDQQLLGRETRVNYDLLRATGQFYVCIFGCRDGSVTSSQKEMIRHLIDKHTD